MSKESTHLEKHLRGRGSEKSPRIGLEFNNIAGSKKINSEWAAEVVAVWLDRGRYRAHGVMDRHEPGGLCNLGTCTCL